MQIGSEVLCQLTMHVHVEVGKLGDTHCCRHSSHGVIGSVHLLTECLNGILLVNRVASYLSLLYCSQL